MQSLKDCWFKVKVENVEKIDQGEDIQRDDIYKINEDNCRVLSVFKKSYNKWRLERSGKKKEKLKVHLQLLDEFLGWYNVHPSDKYICVNSKDLGNFVGHALLQLTRIIIKKKLLVFSFLNKFSRVYNVDKSYKYRCLFLIGIGRYVRHSFLIDR